MAGQCGEKMAVHNFAAKLEFSRGICEENDLELFQKNIDGCVSVRKTSVEEDKQGIDYIATLRGGTEIRIDAKTRAKGSKQYWKHGEAELALEIYSVMPSIRCPKGVAGWTLNESKAVDLILYTFHPDDWPECYLLPFQHLRMAFIRNYYRWADVYSITNQCSGSWRSRAMFVPAKVVIDAINEVMRIAV